MPVSVSWHKEHERDYGRKIAKKRKNTEATNAGAGP
jgi:hypothetical protein